MYALSITDASDTANDYENKLTDVPDYVHFNSMHVDENGNLICSLRHLNTIICLDRTKTENQILWKLSGKGDEFGLTDEQKSSCQHYATVENGYITIFDNGNAKNQSRICSYKLDTANKKATDVKIYSIAGKNSNACGSAQRLSGDIFVIGWGRAMNDNVCLSVYDFATNTELMSMKLAMPQNFTYRCVYYE